MSTQQAIAVSLTFVSIVVTIVLFLVGTIMRQNARRDDVHNQSLGEMKRSVQKQEVTLTRVDSTLGSVVERVANIDRWRERLQEDERQDLRAQLEQLRRERESA